MPIAYVRIIKDMYSGVRARIRTLVGDTNDFPIDSRLHQGSALSPFIFMIVMNELTRGIEEEIPYNNSITQCDPAFARSGEIRM